MRNMVFAKRFKLLRKNSGLTQEETSVVFNVVQQSVQKWESGENMPKKAKLVEIANYFRVTTDWLLGYSDKEMPVASLTKTDQELLRQFWQLNDLGRRRLLDTLSDLLALPKYTENSFISVS